MTIVTQLLSEKKLSKAQQEPLVKKEEEEEEPPNTKCLEEGSPVLVTMHAHTHRVSTTTTLCVFITALIVLSTGIVGGVYLYKQFAQYRLRHFRGWCLVPFIPDPQDSQISSISLQRQSGGRFSNLQHDPLTQTQHWSGNQIDNRFFEEEIDIDIEFQQYERIQVPDFSHGRNSRFVHDFSVNKTGIIDLQIQCCFVMPLNRSTVLPPQLLFDIVDKMRAGYYDVDREIIRETMRVLTPAITDFKTVGYYIAQECATMPTYYLERVASPVYKRSLNSKDKATFTQFAGKIAEFNIINMSDAPGALTPKKN